MPMQESKSRIDGNDSLTATVVVFSNVTTDLPTFSYALGSTDAEHERLIRQAARFAILPKDCSEMQVWGLVSVCWTLAAAWATWRC